MEAMLEAVDRLRARGFHSDLSATPGGVLRCGSCGEAPGMAGVAVIETVRFEGDSNPDDESILMAISMPCGHSGVYGSAYGPDTPADDVEVLHALAFR